MFLGRSRVRDFHTFVAYSTSDGLVRQILTGRVRDTGRAGEIDPPGRPAGFLAKINLGAEPARPYFPWQDAYASQEHSSTRESW